METSRGISKFPPSHIRQISHCLSAAGKFVEGKWSGLDFLSSHWPTVTVLKSWFYVESKLFFFFFFFFLYNMDS